LTALILIPVLVFVPCPCFADALDLLISLLVLALNILLLLFCLLAHRDHYVVVPCDHRPVTVIFLIGFRLSLR
jgi:hypothetical protein